MIDAVFAGMGIVEDDIVECFRKGGGVPYEKFPGLHEILAEDSNNSVVSLESHILPLISGLTSSLSKRHSVLWILGAAVGWSFNGLQNFIPTVGLWESIFPKMRLHLHETKHRDAQGLNNIEFLAKDLSNFNETADPESFDFITTFDALFTIRPSRCMS